MAGGILLLLLLCYMDRVKRSREVENPLFLLLLLSLLVLFPPFFQESTLAAAVVAAAAGIGREAALQWLSLLLSSI